MPPELGPDALTPRESKPWTLNEDMAKALAKRCRERELVLSHQLQILDVGRAAVLRHLRIVLEDYAAIFRRWTALPPTDPFPRENREFSMLVQLAIACLAE